MKYLNFKEDWSKTGKTKVITLLSMSDDAKLGTIQWSGRWRQYVFVPTIHFETQWSVGCMQDVINLIERLRIERNESLAMNRMDSIPKDALSQDNDLQKIVEEKKDE